MQPLGLPFDWCLPHAHRSMTKVASQPSGGRLSAKAWTQMVSQGGMSRCVCFFAWPSLRYCSGLACRWNVQPLGSELNGTHNSSQGSRIRLRWPSMAGSVAPICRQTWGPDRPAKRPVAASCLLLLPV